VTPGKDECVLVAILAFCRIGGCVMLLPGFASARVPAQVRLYLALAATLALLPLVFEDVQRALPKERADFALVIAAEVGAGALIGLLARVFFLALQFAASAITAFIGLAGSSAAPIEDPEPASPLSALITMPASLLFLVMDLHVEVVRTLCGSYAAMPAGELLGAEQSLGELGAVLRQAFALAVQVSAPFLVYALTVNFLFGVVNKMIPQVPAYFVSVPFVIAGGLALLYVLIAPMLLVFAGSFAAWLAAG
jgi:flagellar biosynthesis protein FliR